MEQSIINLSILLIITLVLYYKSLKYCCIIDDFLKREAYYTYGVVIPPWELFDHRVSKWERASIIGIHFVNVVVIYLLWGFLPALIFSCSPLSVWGAAWITGSMYSTAAMFTLIAYYIIHQFPNAWGALVSATLFNAGINSTICPLLFPFMAIFEPWIAVFFIPFIWLLNSSRFKTALEVRNNLYDNPVKFDWRRIFVMVKVIGRYTYQAIIPNKPCMFTGFGQDIRENKVTYELMHQADAQFYTSLALIVSVFTMGMLVSPFGICWFFGIIALHSQFNLTGQFYAQRYLYLPLVGMVIVLGGVLKALSPIAPYLAPIYLTWLFFKASSFVSSFKNQDKFLMNDINTNPDYYYTYNNLAIHLLNRNGDINQVLALLKTAEKVKPDAWETQMNISKAYIHNKQYDLALEHTEKGLKYATEPAILEIFTDRKEQLINKLTNTTTCDNNTIQGQV